MEQINIADEMRSIPSTERLAVFDTGTSYAYFSFEVAEWINTALGATLYAEASSAQSKVYEFDCSRQYTKSLDFVFSGQSFRVTSAEYISILSEEGSADRCLRYRRCLTGNLAAQSLDATRATESICSSVRP